MNKLKDLNESILSITNENLYLRNKLDKSEKELKEVKKRLEKFKAVSSRIGNFYLNNLKID